MTLRAPLAACALIAAAALVAGCAGTAAPHRTDAAIATPTPTASSAWGSLGAGFWNPADPPAPEATFTPAPGSWDGVHAPAGYRAVLLKHGADAATSTLVSAVRSWADAEHVTLTTLEPSSSARFIDATLDAVAQHPDLVIVAGNDMVDPVAAVSPSHLDQQFLIVGAQVAEPTSNVTAADWTGAGFRGEGLGLPSAYDPATFTADRAGRALRAGVAAVLAGATGYIVSVD